MANNQNVKLHGKPVGLKQGQIPADQQAARDLRAKKRDEQTLPRNIPSPRAAAKAAGESVGNWLRRGLNNFAENSQRPVFDEPRNRPQREAPNRAAQKGKRQAREAAPERRGSPINLGPEPVFNPEMLNMGGGGLDFSMHPDPMYQGLGGSRKRQHERGDREEKGGRLVKVVTRTYRED